MYFKSSFGQLLFLYFVLSFNFYKLQSCPISVSLSAVACTPCSSTVSVTFSSSCNNGPYLVTVSGAGSCSTSAMAVSLTVASTPTTVFIRGLCPCSTGYGIVVTDNSTNLQLFCCNCFSWYILFQFHLTLNLRVYPIVMVDKRSRFRCKQLHNSNFSNQLCHSGLYNIGFLHPRWYVFRRSNLKCFRKWWLLNHYHRNLLE